MAIVVIGGFHCVYEGLGASSENVNIRDLSESRAQINSAIFTPHLTTLRCYTLHAVTYKNTQLNS